MAGKANTVQSILQDAQQGHYAPVYFLMGDEPYYIDMISDYLINHILTEDQREFDQSVFYGKDFERGAAAIFTAARRYPMLSPYQVIAIKEAQLIKNLEEDLAVYYQNPTPTTILIISYKGKKLDKRRKLASQLEQTAVVFESKAVRDYDMPAWIMQEAASMGFRIDARTTQILADYLGTDLSRVVSELTKLKIVLGGKSQDITPEVVEKHIGISKDFNNFELVNALTRKDMYKAHRIARYYAQNPKEHPVQLITVVLYDFFSKLLIYQYLADKSASFAAKAMGVAPFLVRDYDAAARLYSVRKILDNITLIREYDARSKGFRQTALADGELLRELLSRLMA